MPASELTEIARTIIDTGSTGLAQRQALDKYARICCEVTGIKPDPGFQGWSGDTILGTGVAINPEAAAWCTHDYQRSVVFIRAVFAAIQHCKQTHPDASINILYAGCGPFATLLLPVLSLPGAETFCIELVDIHPQSLESVKTLLHHFELNHHQITLTCADASQYHPAQRQHLIIAETMQKALEQEPQFAVTANLATHLHPLGVFIPQRIDIDLCLADWGYEKALYKASGEIDETKRQPLARLFSLTPEEAPAQMLAATFNQESGKFEIPLANIKLPDIPKDQSLDALLLTRISVFEEHSLADYESEITLAHKCYELSPLKAGENYRASYQLGSYPKFSFVRQTTRC